MAKRDEFCDSGRQGSKPITKAAASSYVDMRPSTLDEEAAGKGWIRTTHPTGGEPMPAQVAGSRGEQDDSDTPGHEVGWA